MPLGWLLLAVLPEPVEDAPLVEILESAGAIDAAAGGAPQWDRVRLDLSVRNRLPVDIDQVHLELSLVTKGERPSDEEPIPGWRLEQSFGETVVAARDQLTLTVDRALPARRTMAAADQIAYRVRLIGYRPLAPSLELAARLLESPAASDQRAAFSGYERLADGGAPPGVPELVVRELARALASPAKDPDGAAALQLLIAVRAAGLVGLPEVIPLILALPERLEAARWDPAVGDLASRMIEGSEADDPRLLLLPSWTRTRPAGLAERGTEVVASAAREAVLALGERGVPDLVRAAGLGDSDLVRAQATSALRAMGRGSVRSQLSIADGAVRRRLIEVYGEIGSAEFAAALAELVCGHDRDRRTAMAALIKIGPAAVQPMVDALGTPDPRARAALIEVLAQIGPAGHRELSRAATRFGIAVDTRAGTSSVARRLAERLAANTRAHLRAEIRAALAVAAAGDSEQAFRQLDAIYARDPALYMEEADQIAGAYLRHAKALYGRGNYDAAVEALRTGRTIQRLPEIDRLLRQAQLTLARGYLSLDQIERAEEALDAAALPAGDAEGRALRAELLTRKAELELERREYGRARALVDRARALAPNAEATRALNRRLVLTENLVIVLVLSLLLPGGAVGLVVLFRRRAQAARLNAM